MHEFEHRLARLGAAGLVPFRRREPRQPNEKPRRQDYSDPGVGPGDDGRLNASLCLPLDRQRIS